MAVGHLADLVAARERVCRAVDDEVLRLRRQRLSWTAIGAVLGVTRQAARQRYSSHAATGSPDSYGSSECVRDSARLQPTDPTADEMTDTGGTLRLHGAPDIHDEGRNADEG
jgi:hypothetical protein